ncbi:SpoIIIAH-like family protein [Gracilibacillus thailandensis]|uniref:SpoIIIAH-like family protein n=1 Tax=Gracilibacillus thailandensis TaxID=563735 RepID=A0A6N7R0G3_9BACI|nr:SpoIIIAH-like family protein [Gracilibacillus thailandensis]MRI67274.1 SpoIIIAH-like family protein [Gracilibacillus thailandensis]
MLKKQTVWLLTMLSLMIVLSVYYLNAPTEGDLAYFDADEQQDQTTSSSNLDQLMNDSNLEETEEASMEEDAAEEETEMDDLNTSSINTNDYFTATRIEITNQRSAERERLEEIVASSDSSSDEKNEAYEAMKEIDTLNTKENILEEELKSNGYEEVLVRNVSDNNLVISVQADSLSATEANQIIQQAKDEFGEIKIEVNYKSS